ncbi:MAG TPA: helicase-related protein [Myxococcaceae bacterium]|jgi:ATP-dependent helicase HepA
MKVRYVPQPEWGIGHLVALHEGGSKAEVLFPAREGGPVLVSTKGGSLQPYQLSVGALVRNAKGRTGAVTGEEPGGRGLRRYTVRYDDGEDDELPESELRAQAPRPDLLSTLREGRVGDARNFLLRRRALVLDDERRCDALGALLASRVMVKPHQVGVVQRVLSARRPRFVLADEVGLGKTIEAGMIFSALRLNGLASRVLVVAPSHLTVQWLAELFHKFNQLFTLMDSDRHAASVKEQPDRSPWARFDKVVTSLELLSRTDEYLAQAADPSAAWDLVIIDEAHHLKSERAFAAARKLAQSSWGLLLLTATPMQLDPAEYHGLLTLIDPATAPTLDGFQERLKRQEDVSTAVRGLLEGGQAPEAIAALSKRFPADDRLKALARDKDRGALLSHLAETYSLSERLIRNRRAVVGGFAQRALQRHPVQLGEAELKAREAAVKLLAEKGNVRGAALSQLLRRLESSTAAFIRAAQGSKALGKLKDELPKVEKDAKLVAFLDVLRGIWAKEKGAKVLVFTESRETLDMLQAELLLEKIEPLAYHGDLPLLDRDRQVARFRDPEGPKVLVCTEVGGEGRNFQFSHHLVNYDLPWSPAVMEQRIGRLDRIGQTRPVEIHVFEQPPGTLSHDVLAILADSVGVFGETVGGLDAVLEEVEPSLTELALAEPTRRAEYAAALKVKVAEARAAVKRAYDPLLDRRSFDKEAVEALVERARSRFGVEADEEDGLEEGLWSLARDLDERLEEAVTDLARKIGIGVDTDEQVDAFQCAFQFGHAVNVDALPGLNIADERTILGTFWRDTAVEQEEIEYFATGHNVVEALFGFLRDGPYGRNGVRFLERRGTLKARGLEALFHVVPPEAADTSPGARVPSRQLSRFLDRQLVRVAVALGPTGKPKVDPTLLGVLEDEGRSLKGDEIRAAFPELAGFVDPAIAEATRAAEVEMRALAEAARASIAAERDGAVRRMRLSLQHQGLAEAAIAQQLKAEEAHYQALLDALSGLKIALDSACAFVINR